VGSQTVTGEDSLTSVTHSPGSTNDSHRPDTRDTRDHIGIGSGALIGDLGHVSLQVAGAVVDVLDASVGESHRVGALTVAGSVVGLCGLEVGAGVVVGHVVLVGVGGDLVRVDLGTMDSVGESVTDHTMSHSTDETVSSNNTMS